MDAELISSAIAGGLGGLHQDFSEQRRLKQQENIAQIRGEIQAMIAQLNGATRRDVAETGAGAKVETATIGANSRENVADTNAGAKVETAQIGAGSRVDVANINQGGANYRHDNVSGDTTARESGADRRLTKNLEFGVKKLGVDSADRRYATDTGAATSRRGQDFNLQLGGERNALTERGQNIDFGLGVERNFNARNRKPSIFEATFADDPAGGAAPPVAAPSAPTPTLPAPVVKPGGGAPPAPAAAAATPQRAPIPVTPRAAAPAKAAPGTDALATLTAQAAAALASYKAEQDPAKRRQLAAQLAELKRRKEALGASGGGK